jgi:hypothetical protein
MVFITSLAKHPEKIDDPRLLEDIIITLSNLFEQYKIDYAFFRVQSLSFGEGYYLAPITYIPSKRSIILEKFDKKYFERKHEQLKNSV